MTSTTMNLVERLYLRLLEALRQGGVRHDQGITVGDVYQHLVPYRAVRSELGVFELAEYEHALLRLLAGEGGFLQVSDEAVRAELAAELRSPNPILGIYRDYAGSPIELLRPDEAVRLTPPTPATPAAESEEFEEETVRSVADFLQDDSDDVGTGAARPSAGPEGTPDAADAEDPQPLPRLDYPFPTPAPADATRVAGGVPSPPTEGSQRRQPAGAECLGCGRTLPEVEGLRFCPHCGTDQTLVPCEHCGTPLRAEWRFCIRCGVRRSIPPSAEA